MTTQYRNFERAAQGLRIAFKTRAQKVSTKNWQGTNVELRPEMRSHELLMESFQIDLAGFSSLEHWRLDIQPNLPWADDHFEERVCGYPINPGVEWANWPWSTSADGHRDANGMFNHNYMERLWPRFAASYDVPTKTGNDYALLLKEDLGDARPHYGLRGEYGDLSTLVDKLAWDPDSRQIVIPLYFPEDTGAEGRMPCTLLYQFIRRGDRLNIYYPLRSCDFIRHWRDDCYLAVRLLLWVIEQCRERNPKDWDHVTPGLYNMHCTSLHVFENDLRLI